MKTHKQTATQTALLSMFSNAGLAVTKGITGFFGHSDAMIAD
ncbi:MAG: cation-efflux pump, partial [Crocinitomicaceae bacterium]|nr:cation-efflux pump [Crocinitomicaceae bacterium]